jgi:predicted GNAT family acetyltransferase
VADITVTREQRETEGRYVAKIAGVEAEAELAYRRPKPDVVDAYHTLTPPALRGRGIATALVERLIADARREGLRIVPTCPFVSSQFDQHPEWSKLKAD